MYKTIRDGLAVFAWQRNVITCCKNCGCSRPNFSKLKIRSYLTGSGHKFNSSHQFENNFAKHVKQSKRCLYSGPCSYAYFDSNKLRHQIDWAKGMNSDEKKQQLRVVRIRDKQQKHGKGLNERTPLTSLQIIGDGTKGNPASVMLIAGNTR